MAASLCHQRECSPATPLVKLGDTLSLRKSPHFSRFCSIPGTSWSWITSVSGDVIWTRRVSLRGTMIFIIIHHGDRIDIPAGAVLENKIVSGNLRILDH